MNQEKHYVYNPQKGASFVAITSIEPCPIDPPFNLVNTSCAMLNPAPALLIAVIGIEIPFAGFVMFQHSLQLGELNPMSNAPPIKGNEGMALNIGNFAARPLSLFEHVMLLREPSLLLYVTLNVAQSGVGVGAA